MPINVSFVKLNISKIENKLKGIYMYYQENKTIYWRNQDLSFPKQHTVYDFINKSSANELESVIDNPYSNYLGGDINLCIYKSQDILFDANIPSKEKKDKIIQFARETKHTIGKFMIVVKPDNIIFVWNYIACGTANGHLGISAKRLAFDKKKKHI